MNQEDFLWDYRCTPRAPQPSASMIPPCVARPGSAGQALIRNCLQVARDLRRFEAEGITVERFNLAQQPEAFVQNRKVAGLLQAFGEKALPVTLINDDIFVYGRYPSRDEMVAALVQQREQEPVAAQNADGGCDCGSGGCC